MAACSEEIRAACRPWLTAVEVQLRQKPSAAQRLHKFVGGYLTAWGSCCRRGVFSTLFNDPWEKNSRNSSGFMAKRQEPRNLKNNEVHHGTAWLQRSSVGLWPAVFRKCRLTSGLPPRQRALPVPGLGTRAPRRHQPTSGLPRVGRTCCNLPKLAPAMEKLCRAPCCILDHNMGTPSRAIQGNPHVSSCGALEIL